MTVAHISQRLVVEVSFRLPTFARMPHIQECETKGMYLSLRRPDPGEKFRDYLDQLVQF